MTTLGLGGTDLLESSDSRAVRLYNRSLFLGPTDSEKTGQHEQTSNIDQAA
jgi:hypothetical protein